MRADRAPDCGPQTRRSTCLPLTGTPTPKVVCLEVWDESRGVIKGLNGGSSRSDSSQLESAGASLERHSNLPCCVSVPSCCPGADLLLGPTISHGRAQGKAPWPSSLGQNNSAVQTQWLPHSPWGKPGAAWCQRAVFLGELGQRC